MKIGAVAVTLCALLYGCTGSPSTVGTDGDVVDNAAGKNDRTAADLGGSDNSVRGDLVGDAATMVDHAQPVDVGHFDTVRPDLAGRDLLAGSDANGCAPADACATDGGMMVTPTDVPSIPTGLMA